MRLLMMTVLFILGMSLLDLGIELHAQWLQVVGGVLLAYWAFGARGGLS